MALTNTLCEKAAGLFIYASTVVKIVAAKNHQPTRRLADIVGLPQSTVQEGRSGLDKLYTEVLEVAFLDEQADDEGFYSCFKSVVGAVILVFNPLSIPALSDILEISDILSRTGIFHALFTFVLLH